MSALICGSMAFDTIMVFEDRFKNHIIPDQIHILNVCFFTPHMRREFGGCAGNIAYNMKLLGGDPLPMATVGRDFGPYRQRLGELGIPDTHVKTFEDSYTAQAFITTDLDDNQITAFHPGAMNEAHANHVKDADGVSIGIVAPDGRDAMIQHAADFAGAGIPFVFDPGQGLPMFDGEELTRFVDQASYVIVNDYESSMLKEKTGLSDADIAARTEAYIVTRGGEGSILTAGGETTTIPAIKVGELEDPTGCGDAYRGGLIYAVMQGWDLADATRLASVMGGIKIEKHGTQNHRPSRDEILDRFKDNYGHRPD